MSGYDKKLAKKIKSKGLGKLKFFCQMCQKQCRDANGFKCHAMSEGHLRQMEIFRQNPGKMMDEFSKKFENGFINLLSRRWRSKTVNANIVYNEFIHDKEHVHMNSTKWDSLTSFARYLGQTGKCTVEESERGLMLRWIDPDVKKQQRKERKLIQSKANEIERKRREMNERIERAKELEKQIQRKQQQNGLNNYNKITNTSTHGNIYDGNGNHVMNVIKVDNNRKRKRLGVGNAFGDEDAPQHIKTSILEPMLIPTSTTKGTDDDNNNKTKKLKLVSNILQSSGIIENKSIASSSSNSNNTVIVANTNKNTGTSTINNNMANDDHLKNNKTNKIVSPPPQQQKQQQPSEEVAWLMKGIVVKVMDKNISNGIFYKKKGYVKKVIDKYGGKIVMDSGEKIILDQKLLETVIPKAGSSSKIMILYGPMRGLTGYVHELLLDEYKASIQLEDRNDFIKLEYEHISKIHIKKKKK